MRGPFAPIRSRVLRAKSAARSVTSPLAGEGQGGGEPMHRDGVRRIQHIHSVTAACTPHPCPLPAKGRETRLMHRALETTP